MKRPELDPNAQKTHYIIDPTIRKKANVAQDSTKPKLDNANRSPFCKLLHEKPHHVLHRFSLYEKIWGHQLGAIQKILNSANNELFANLLQFIEDPITPKLNVAFLGLSSNTANNLRVLDDFSFYMRSRPAQYQNLRVVTLNSKTCFNVKIALREVVKQVLEGPSRRGTEEDNSVEEQEDENAENEENLPVKEDNGDEDFEEAEQEEVIEGDGGRISYDFEIVEDWIKDYSKQEKDTEKLRIVVILEDTNGFSNEVLNQLVQLFCVYATRAPLKLIMSLSSKNISDWITANITSKLRTMINGCKLEAKENKDIGFQVINDILLQNEITPDNPLLLDARLSLIVLNRFENSNNSIDSLITELKLSYMIHFYQLPLSSLVDNNFPAETFHYAALRKLPSFKTYMESRMHQLAQMEPGSIEAQKAKDELVGLLTDDEQLQRLLEKAKSRFQNYQNAVMNAVHIVHHIGGASKEKFQIYKLITNNQLINSVYLSDMLKKLKLLGSKEFLSLVHFINSDAIKERIGNCIDRDIAKLKEELKDDKNKLWVDAITDYLYKNENVNMKIHDNLFNEVLTINGGISELENLSSSTSIEENYENLMISLIRPKLREIIEKGMDEPQKYLRNALVLEHIGQENKSMRMTGPVLSKIYQVYKDAPVNINLWDFYLAFKLSLQQKDLLSEIANAVKTADTETSKMMETLLKDIETDEKQWDKLAYAWFLQSCFELESMGFLREKSKGDYVEKLIWKNL